MGWRQARSEVEQAVGQLLGRLHGHDGPIQGHADLRPLCARSCRVLLQLRDLTLLAGAILAALICLEVGQLLLQVGDQSAADPS